MTENELKELQEIREKFTSDQKKAYAIAMMGESMFITGGPGTGKSFLIKALIKGFESLGQSVLIMAPTGIAAVNVGGTTIHRALGLKRGEVIKEDNLTMRAKKCPLLDSADVVLIDEISMVRMDLFEYVAKCIRASERRTGKKLQLIVVGDFFQLPPVMLPESKELLECYYKSKVGRAYCFQTKEWESFDFHNVILKESVRQKDAGFIVALNKLRIGDTSCLKYFNQLPGTDDRFPYLVSTNEQAERLNRIRLEEFGKRYNTEPHLFEMECEGSVKQSDMVVPERIGLYPGVRVMMVVNDPAGRYQNGTCGVVRKLSSGGGYIIVDLDNGKKNVRIELFTWKVMKNVIDEDGAIQQEEAGRYTQLPLRLAYAITIHKSQGQTYDEVNIDPDCWEAAQLYVALSRVRSPGGIHLMRKISASTIIVDTSVKHFYQRMDGYAKEKVVLNEIVSDEIAEVPAGEKEKTENKEQFKANMKNRVGRPSPFAEGTKRIRVGADMADYIQDICKKQATEGGKIRLLPDELDICLVDALSSDIDFTEVTFMAVPLELEGKFRMEVKMYETKTRGI